MKANPHRQRTAYILSACFMLIGAAGFFLRHYLFCGILSLALFAIGLAWMLLLVIKQRAPAKTARAILLIFHLLAGLLLISFIGAEIPVIRHASLACRNDTAPDEAVQTILVPGAGLMPGSESPSLLFRLRLDEAKRLYEQDPRLKIVICGGQGDDEIVAEAIAGRNYLLRNGIPDNAVVAETESNDTAENFRNFRALFPEETQVALVTNDFHVYRCKALAERYGLTVTAYAMPTPRVLLRLNYFMREYVSLAIFLIESHGIVIDTANFHI